jgi:hypothetical protein
MDEAWRQCQQHCWDTDVSSYETNVTRVIEHCPPDDAQNMGRFLFVRGLFRVVTGSQSAAGENDLITCMKVEPARLGGATFISFCGALVAGDDALAKQRDAELRKISQRQPVFPKALTDLWDAHKSKKRPANLKPFDEKRAELLNVAFTRTVDKIAPLKKK